MLIYADETHRDCHPKSIKDSIFTSGSLGFTRIMVTLLFHVNECASLVKAEKEVFYESFDESFEKIWTVSNKEDYLGEIFLDSN
ncbi:hypothetical protein M8C21_029610, partial [Ambrosia artemisiifolia]